MTDEHETTSTPTMKFEMIRTEIRDAKGRSYVLQARVGRTSGESHVRATVVVMRRDEIVAETYFTPNTAMDDQGRRLFPGEDVYENHPFVVPSRRRRGILTAMIRWFESWSGGVVRPSSALFENGATAFWIARGYTGHSRETASKDGSA